MRNRTCESCNTTTQTQSCNYLPCQGEIENVGTFGRLFVCLLFSAFACSIVRSSQTLRISRSFLSVLKYLFARFSSFIRACLPQFVRYVNKTVGCSLGSLQTEFVLTTLKGCCRLLMMLFSDAGVRVQNPFTESSCWISLSVSLNRYANADCCGRRGINCCDVHLDSGACHHLLCQRNKLQKTQGKVSKKKHFTPLSLKIEKR